MGIWEQTRGAAARIRLADERLHKIALDELNGGIRRDGLWAKALVAAAGDEKAVIAAYIRLRVEALRDEDILSGATRMAAAPEEPDLAVGSPGVDRDSYFDWRGFFKMLGIALAVIAGIGLFAALVS